MKEEFCLNYRFKMHGALCHAMHLMQFFFNSMLCLTTPARQLLLDLRADLIHQTLHLVVGEINPFFLQQVLNALARVLTLGGGKEYCDTCTHNGTSQERI